MSDKLLPCPFCGGAFGWHVGGANDDILFSGCVSPSRCVSWATPFTPPNFESAFNYSRERWNRRTQPDNPPLTLDELVQMDGEPVWIVEYPQWGHWELSEDAEDYLDDRDEDFYNMRHNDPAGRYGLHALGWLAYRNKLQKSEV